MKSDLVTHTSDSAQDEVVLNAGRVDTGKVDVDKTLALLNEALGGQLFQDVKNDLSNSQPDDEVINVQNSETDSDSEEMPVLSVEPGDIRPFRVKAREQVKQNSKSWLSRLAARLPKIAS